MADIFIDPYAAFDGSGSIGSPRNVFPTVTSGNNYYVKRGTTLRQAATIALSAVANVVVDAYGGFGGLPILDAGNTVSANITVANSSAVRIRNLACMGATNVNGALQISGTSDDVIFERLDAYGAQTVVLVSGAGCTNCIVQDSTLTSPQMNNQGVDLSAVGAGCKVRRNTIRHTGLDRNQTSLYGVYANGGAAVEVTDNDIAGFYNGVEIRADSSLVSLNDIVDCYNAGASLRDCLNASVSKNAFNRIWNGLEYNGGAGAGLGGGLGSAVLLVDVGTAVGGCNVYANRMYNCYQGVLSQADNTGGNSFWSNLIVRPRVNCINYQDKAGRGKIFHNTCIVAPQDSVLAAGHGIGVQLGGVATAADIKGNLIQVETLSSNTQAIALGGTPGTNYLDVALDYNLYWLLNGAHLGQVSGVNYDDLTAWRAALAGVAQVTVKDPTPNTVFGDPGLTGAYRPTLLGIGNCPFVAGAYDAYGSPRGNPATRGAVEGYSARVKSLQRVSSV